MLTILGLALLGLVTFYFVQTYQSYARNLVEAKKSGIPYVSVPIYPYNVLWLIGSRSMVPLLNKLPTALTSPWLQYLQPEWMYVRGYSPFENLDFDLLLLVTPRANFLIVADAEATAQIVTRRNDFPKPAWMYKNINIYGDNVVTTEGSMWRQHRKISAPSFGEKNNTLVWKESLYQAQEMLKAWTGGKDAAIVQDVTEATMRLALHVISRAGFGVRVQWPHEEEEAKKKGVELKGFAGSTPEGDHKLSYKDALAGLLDNLIWAVIVPKWFAAISPWKSHHEGVLCRKEWGMYMNELYQAKLTEVRSGQDSNTDGMDLLGSLIRGSGIADAGAKKTALLSEEEIAGNMFVFILAGHETTSNSIAYSLTYLAMNPESQRALQADIDRILGNKDLSDWNYDDDFPKLFGGMPAAVMNETLRLLPAVVGIPKSTPPGFPQPLTLGGKRVVVPGDCSIAVNSVGLHRNPKYWPPVVDAKTGKTSPNDVNEFRPERWIVDASATSNHNNEEDFEQHDDGGPSGPDTSAQLFKPMKGAYVPFSEGFRSCLGRRFAQVETLAVLTYIFREYSVELAVDRWADDETVQRMSESERKTVWQKALSRAEGLFKTNMQSRVTLQMTGNEKVGLRFVKRGSEVFA
ncbi:cytochrome P450 [Pseudovirgaria hyperparasitica]|uniref:Cytochrome P450 n=1 Tax=Pseudovirgaria hyperparasitica TaxID=470096 RepID=A0A6A6VVD6_9PEZI|nr:cytochrome P450 [Pseudovirgaria hyperparasitica]KAF2753580.1 cytochrome P450 [Pseudovirgaria hyperparasitica]